MHQHDVLHASARVLVERDMSDEMQRMPIYIACHVDIQRHSCWHCVRSLLCYVLAYVLDLLLCILSVQQALTRLYDVSLQSYYGIAVAGCLYINAANLRKAVLTYLPSTKPTAARGHAHHE